MSPAVAKTSDREILTAARRLIVRNGVDGLALRDVAVAVGIKTPSLYKRFADRAALLRALKDLSLAELELVLRQAAGQSPPSTAFNNMAHAYRDFAKCQPEMYRLIHRPELKTDGLEAERKAAEPALKVMAALAGNDFALSSARCITSFLHGFVTMEIDGNFRLGGSIDEAFTFSLEAILNGIKLKKGI
jgi:AcrR family transcriptional regulator